MTGLAMAMRAGDTLDIGRMDLVFGGEGVVAMQAQDSGPGRLQIMVDGDSLIEDETLA